MHLSAVCCRKKILRWRRLQGCDTAAWYTRPMLRNGSRRRILMVDWSGELRLMRLNFQPCVRRKRIAMESIIIVLHILIALGIIGFVMIQQGKGADAGASFGSGASQTVFGSSGS